MMVGTYYTQLIYNFFLIYERKNIKKGLYGSVKNFILP